MDEAAHGRGSTGKGGEDSTGKGGAEGKGAATVGGKGGVSTAGLTVEAQRGTAARGTGKGGGASGATGIERIEVLFEEQGPLGMSLRQGDSGNSEIDQPPREGGRAARNGLRAGDVVVEVRKALWVPLQGCGICIRLSCACGVEVGSSDVRGLPPKQISALMVAAGRPLHMVLHRMQGAAAAPAVAGGATTATGAEPWRSQAEQAAELAAQRAAEQVMAAMMKMTMVMIAHAR